MPDFETKSNGSRYVSKVWVADNGDGTYRNPILYADYSDPDVIRVGKDYYMTASSFNCVPGLPVLHSKDLVNWKITGHALPELHPPDRYSIPQHSKGVWAPCIRHHKGCFYIYWGDPDLGIYMVKSEKPSSGWEKPVQVLPGKGLIDPSPFWDDDGNAYLVHAWAYSRAGINSILTLRRMNAEGTEVVDEGRKIFDGHNRHHTVEGPKLYKRCGYYYIFAPAGGVTSGWQLVMRSKDIYGPYQPRVVLEQGSTKINGPHQGGWVDTHKGQNWFIHFQDAGTYGRIVHLQPMKWIDDWPVIGNDKNNNGTGEPVTMHQKPDVGKQYPVVTPAESDEFESNSLGLQWQWQANPKAEWYSLVPDKSLLRLFAIRVLRKNANLHDIGNLLLQKFPAPDFTVSIRMRFSPESNRERAGLVVMGNDYACLSVSDADEKNSLSQTICKDANKGAKEKITEQQTISSGEIYLRVKVTSPKGHCSFSYSLDGKKYNSIGKRFASKPGGWMGAKVGIFCVGELKSAKSNGYADFDWFRIE